MKMLMVGSKEDRAIDYEPYHRAEGESRDYEVPSQWEKLVNGTLRVDGKELLAMAKRVLPKWYSE
jgi:hypothetical protein